MIHALDSLYAIHYSRKWRRTLNTNPRIYFYKGKLPLSIIPLVLFVLIFLTLFAILGLFIGVILGAAMLGFIVLRLLISSKKKQAKLVEEDNRTIVLNGRDYEIIEKGRKE